MPWNFPWSKGDPNSRAKRTDSHLAVQQVLSVRKPKTVPSLSQLAHLPELLNATERKIFFAGAWLATLALLLFGWHLWNGQRVIAPAVGGAYTEGLVGTPQLINPLYSTISDVDADLTRLIYSGLMRQDPEDGLVTDLAASYTISEDGKTYTFTLREDAKWHDGNLVKIEDILFTFAAIQNKEYRSPLAIRFAGVTISEVDEKTISFSLNEPFTPFLSLLTVGILPSHIWQNVSPLSASLADINRHPVGSGPYAFEKLKKDGNGTIHEYTLTRHQDFYGEKASIDTLSFRFYHTPTEAIAALKNKQIEGVGYVPLAELSDLSGERDLQFVFTPLAQYTAIFFNQRHQTILADDVVRASLVMATDRQGIVSGALFSHGKPITSFLLPGQPGYQDTSVPTADPVSATVKLEAAGWVLPEDGSGIRKKGDQTLHLTLVTLDAPELTATAHLLQEQWKRIGVDLGVQVVDAGTLQNDILKDRNYDMILSGERYGTDVDPYPFWHSSQANYPGLNLSLYADRKADEAIEKGRAATKLEDRVNAYQALQTLIAEENAALFLYQPDYAYTLTKSVQNVVIGTMSTPSDRWNGIANWYMKTKKVFKTE